MPYAGTLKNLFIRTGPAFTGSYNWTIFKNASRTGLAITGASAGDTTYSALTQTVAVVAGDLISLVATNGTIADTPLSSWGVELDG